MSEADEFWARKFRERDQRAGVNATAQDRDPQAAARAQRAAKLLGVTPALAEAQPEVTERMVEAKRNQETIAQNPWMTGFLQDPDMAALVPKGELGMLGRVVDGLLGKPLAPTPAPKSLIDSALAGVGVRAPTALPEITPSARRYQTVRATPYAPIRGDLPAQLAGHYFASAMGGLTRAFVGASRAAADGLGLEGDGFLGDGEALNRQLEEKADALQAYYRPQTDSKAGNYAIDAGQMLADMALGFGIAGKGVAAYFGASTGAQSYAKFSGRSDDKGEAAAGAVVDAAAEYAFEKTPMGLVAKAFGGKYAAGVIGEYLLREVGGEAATGGIQYTANTTLADPTEEFSTKGLGTAMLDSAVVAVLGGGMIAGLAAPHQQRLKRAARDVQDIQANSEAMAAQSSIDGAMALAEKSEMAKIAPDEFAQVIQQGADTGAVRQVYVPVETIDKLLENPDLAEEERATLTLYQQQIDDARPGNSDVVIPVGEFVARFKGSLYQSLRDDIRTTPGGPSAKEAREFEERKVKELEALDKVAADSETADPQQGGADQPSSEASSKQQVFDLVKTQSLAAGRTEGEAQTTALLAASRAENLATERYGAYPDAMAAWKDVGFTIAPKKGKGKKGAAKSVATQEQSAVGGLQGFLRDVEPRALNGLTRSQNRARSALEKEGKLLIAEMPLNSLIGTQLDVNDDFTEAATRSTERGDEFDLPAVFKVDGRYLVGDGHHRLAAAAARGQTTAKVRIYDIDGATGKPPIDMSAPLFIEDVFASTVGDGTGRGTEGVTRTAYQLIANPLNKAPMPNEAFRALGYAYSPRHADPYKSEQTLSIDMLESDQAEIETEAVDRYTADPVSVREGSLFSRQADIYVMKQGGRYFVLDGNNRVNAAVRRGEKSIKATMFDADAREVAIRTVEQGPRGKTDWFADGSTVVTLFAQADFSTMLHEMSHVFLEQEFKLAQGPNASERLKADVGIIEKWFAANGHPVVDGVIPTEAHELWARTGERYFREGKAPSAELRGAFTQFKEWLTGIYQSLKALTAYGPAPITQDIREVMDRIIATGDAIADNALVPMAQADMGMTNAEYAAYVESVKGTQDAAEDVLLNKMMSAIRLRETQRIAEQRRNVRDEINATFNEQPGIRALHLLRTGKWIGEPDREATPVKINTGWLIDNYGEEILDQLPKGLPITRGDGVVGDIVAEMTGMSSGDALVQALVGLRAQSDALRAAKDGRSLRDAYVSRATDEAMAQRHGDIALDEAQIKEEAIAALNSERRGENLITELRALKRREGKGGVVTPYQVLQEWARRKIAEGRVSDVASKSALNRYVRALNRARTAFEEAILKGDSAEAIRQKQAQMVNHVLLAEAKRAADDLGPIVKRMKRYADKEAMASVDQDYMDRIHALLAGFSFRPMSQKAIDERNGFAKWAAAQAEKGNEVHVPPRMGDLSVRNWNETTVADLLELNDTMQSLIELGKLKQKLTTLQQERELREFKDESRALILQLPERRAPDASFGTGTLPLSQALKQARNVKDVGASIRNVFSRWLSDGSKRAASELMKMETLFDRLDGTQDGTGPLNQLVVRGATKAANNFSALMEEVMEPLADLYRNIPKKQRQRLSDMIDIPELTVRVSIDPEDPRIGTPVKVSRMQHITMLLNTGNLSNLSKMVGGEKWGDPESMADLAAVRDILWSRASAEDKALVEALWDGVGKMWPHIVKVERAMSGVVPERVEALGFDTDAGPVRGGYWPVVWDSARSKMGQQQADDAETAMFGIGTGIATAKGHTITRTGATAPMEYSLERVLFGHLNKVISRVAYAEWVRDTLKVVDAGSITGAIDLRLGEAYRKQIKRWIKDQIPSSAIDPQGSKWWEGIINQARINASIGVLGVSYTTGIAQSLGLGFSVGILGEGSKTDGMKYMAQGIYAMLKHMKDGGAAGAQDFVFARSGEMSRRAKEVTVETADVFRQLRDSDSLYHKAQAMAFWHIGFIDLNTVAIPTWLGGYAKGLAQGLTEEEAAAYGDKVVRLSQGSGRQKDLSALQRGNAGQKIAAMFYTPGSVFFNQQWNAVQDARAGNWSKAIMPTFWFLGMTTILDAMMSGDWPDDDDEDGWLADEVPGWIARNMLFGLAFGVPGLRDLSNAAERKARGAYSEFGSTGWNIVIGGTAKGVQAGMTLSEEDSEPMQGKQLKAMIAAGGFVFGLPGNQVGKTVGFAYDAATGQVEPEGGWDWFTGLTSGKLPEKEDAQ